MSISEVMSKCVAECTEDTSLGDVYELIRKCEHGLVVVVDSESHRVPIGVVSEHSICEQLISRGKNPRGLTAGSVLDPRIKTLRETDSTDGIPAAEKDSLTAIVVTNEKRQVCGIVPKGRISQIPTSIAATHSPGSIYVTNVRFSPASREIPAFGWIQ
ncbi:MAG TPA: CBS domain-containing protein [Pyrinomonadaceae bacterium]